MTDITRVCAADLGVLDGIDPLVQLLDGTPQIQAATAYVLGTAASNNIKFQQQLLAAHPGVVAQLLKVRL